MPILANANNLAMIVNYDCNHSFIVLANIIKIIYYNHKTFIVQATELVGHLLNGTAHFKKCKQLFEYQHLLLLKDIWWSKF